MKPFLYKNKFPEVVVPTKNHDALSTFLGNQSYTSVLLTAFYCHHCEQRLLGRIFLELITCPFTK